MPAVSIVMPTYNRADSIERAIESVKAQTFSDWELIIVDDGSTDNTLALIQDTDPRVRVIRQKNKGFVEARNTGVNASTGAILSFLDSDDEWSQFHLELCCAFLAAFPDEQFVATELVEDFGHGRTVNHYRIETSQWYPKKARAIDSDRLALPPGESDDYLRVYSSRKSIGDWGRHVVARLGCNDTAFHYSGNIYDQLRWGYIIAVNSLVLRRSALEVVGLQDPHYNTAADYHYTAKLCLYFRANYLSVPTYIKHEMNSAGALPAESHLATGKKALICAQDMLRTFEDLYWHADRGDRELSRLRGLWQLGVAETALHFGQRDVTLKYLAAARSSFPRLWRAVALQAMVRCLQSVDLTRKAWSAWNRAAHAAALVFRGDLSARVLARKIAGRLQSSVSRYVSPVLLLHMDMGDQLTAWAGPFLSTT